MDRKLATIETIKVLHPIPDADAIERAEVRGWSVVVKKGEFKEGDLCVYCEIDSVMPERPEFQFLEPVKYRIKTRKMRGQVSQGIVFPLEILLSVPNAIKLEKRANDYMLYFDEKLDDQNMMSIVEEMDVTEILGVTKYDPPIPACLGGVAKGNFPSHSIKTDEERIQNLKKMYEDVYKDLRWYATEKLDGSSMTCFIYEGEFGIASRNLTLKEHPENELNSFWKVARKINLEEKMREYMALNNMEALTLQGELIGEGIQKNKYKLKGQEVRFFRMFDPIKYSFDEYGAFLVSMIDMDLMTVPIIDTDLQLPETYEELIAYADGKSALADTAREGIVFVAKGVHERYQNRLSFKVISNKFLLKHGE